MKGKSKGRYFLRGHVWWIAYHDGHGHEIRESAKTADSAKAEKLLEFRLKQVGKAQLDGAAFTVPKARRMTVDKALDEFKTHYELHKKWNEKLFSTWRIVKERFGLMRVEHVTKAILESYQLDCKKEGFANATINRRVGLVLRAIRLAELQPPKLKKLPETNVRQGFFEVWEVRRVIANLPRDIADAVAFAYSSAWRRAEVLTLRWSDVTGDGDVIMLPAERSKNREPRKLVLTGELAELVDRRRKLADGPLIFHREGLPVGDFRRSWRTACRLAGVSGRLFHDLRRSAVRNMVRAGTPERVAMSQSGHLTREIFDRYNVTSEVDLRASQERTEAYLKALAEKQALAVSTAVQ